MKSTYPTFAQAAVMDAVPMVSTKSDGEIMVPTLCNLPVKSAVPMTLRVGQSCMTQFLITVSWFLALRTDRRGRVEGRFRRYFLIITAEISFGFMR